MSHGNSLPHDVAFTAEQTSNFDGKAATLTTTQGLTTSSKVSGSVYFTVSTSALPIPQAQFDALFNAETGVGQVSSTGVSASMQAPSTPEEARLTLLKHMSKGSQIFKPVGINLSNPPLQMTVHEPVVTSTPSKSKISSGVQANEGFKNGSDDGVSTEDAEAARIMKHFAANKGSTPKAASSGRFGGGGGGSGSSTPGGAASVNVSSSGTPGGPASATSPIPAWKLKQMEREKEERERKEQDRLKIAAQKAANLAAAAEETITETLPPPPSSSSSTTSSSASASMSGGVGVGVGAGGGAGVFVTSSAEEEEKLKKEEERIMKLMTAPKLKMGIKN